MADLTPSLACLYSVKRTLSQGKSLREAIYNHINESPLALGAVLAVWINYYESGSLRLLPELKLTSEHQRSILVCFEAGINGQPIQAQLDQLIQEVESASLLEVDEYISSLPLKALLPVFIFQFPAFLILIFGPVVSQLFSGVHNAL